MGRFAYALLLSPMREHFGWDYTAAGSLNTVNAIGYLVGALATPWLSKRFSVNSLVLFGAWGMCVLMVSSPWLKSLDAWLWARAFAGAASALMFLLGGLLAARLGALAAQSTDEGIRRLSAFVVALFYAGTGVGISLSAVAIPAVLSLSNSSAGVAVHAGEVHGWVWGWLLLALLSSLATLALMWPLRVLRAHHAGASVNATANVADSANRARWQSLSPYLVGYTLFGLGYIGYMTFCIALLREKGGSNMVSFFFFLLLGVACMFSASIWGALMRRKDGRPMAILMALCAAATVLVAIAAHPIALMASAIIFGGCFLQVVGSTTALVRHHWAAHEWARGITIFTCVFAAGQVIGPFVTGVIADTKYGLTGGLIMSAAALFFGGVCALFQRGPQRERNL